MTHLFKIGLSNALAASLLVLIVSVVVWKWQNMKVAYLLWLAVLFRFVIPPVFALSISLPEIFPQAERASTLSAKSQSASVRLTAGLASDVGPDGIDAEPMSEDRTGPDNQALRVPAILPRNNQTILSNSTIAIAKWPILSWTSILMLLWGAGSIFLLGRFLIQIRQFLRLIRHSIPAPSRIGTLAQREAENMKLSDCPEIRLIDANISPVIWPVGRRPLVLIPVTLSESLTEDQMRMIFAHEFAHIRRRDHWARWLEVVVTVLYWWNPLMWWARHQWRLAEEMCCDATVLATRQGETHSYAETLVAIVEHLRNQRRSLSVLALKFSNRTDLKRRIEMMLKPGDSRKMTPRKRLILGASGLLFLLPILTIGFQAVNADSKNDLSIQSAEPAIRRSALPSESVATDEVAEVEESVLTDASVPTDESIELTEDVPGRFVRDLEFSPNGRQLAAGSADGKIRIWQIEKPWHHWPVKTLEGHEWGVEALHFSTDGQTLQTVGKNPVGQSVKLWNVETGQLQQTVELVIQPAKTRIDIYAFSPDGSRVIGRPAGINVPLHLWNTATGKSMLKLNVAGVALGASFSHDGELVAVGTIALPPQDGLSDGGVQIFDAKTGKKLHSILKQTGSINALSFSPDNQFLAAGDHRSVWVWNVKTGQLQQELRGHSGVIESIAFSPDGQKIAAGGEGAGFRDSQQWQLLSEVKVWEWKTGKLLQTMAGKSGRTMAIAFSPDGLELARSDFDSIVWEEIQGGRSWVRTLDELNRPDRSKR